MVNMITCGKKPKRCVIDVVGVESGTRHGWSNDDLCQSNLRKIDQDDRTTSKITKLFSQSRKKLN